MRLYSHAGVPQHVLHWRHVQPFWPHLPASQQFSAGFTTRYGIKRLVWFEVHETMEMAILREKRIKRWPRPWKYDLIHKDDPTWRDLAEDLGFEPLPKVKADPGSRPG